MTLDIIRKKIDKIDDKIIELIAKRQSLMPVVGKIKKDNKMSFNQVKREKDILDAKKKKAKEFNVDLQLVEKIFKLIFKNSKDIQREV
jgi:chorismate mutase